MNKKSGAVLQSPIDRLPNELYAKVFCLCPEELAQLRLVNRRFCRVASHPVVQRAALEPALLEPLTYLHKRAQAPQPFSKETFRQAMQYAAVSLQDCATDAKAPQSWMHLLQQAQYSQRTAQAADRAWGLRQAFRASIWGEAFSFCTASLSLGFILLNEGAQRDCQEAVALGVAAVLISLALTCLIPILWLAYNLMGVAAEEFAAFRRHRLETLLSGSCRTIGSILQMLA